MERLPIFRYEYGKGKNDPARFKVFNKEKILRRETRIIILCPVGLM